MIRNLKIVQVDYKYCNYLRMFDNKVTYNYGSKKKRPFVGILFKVNEYEYFAPLSSPKLKHNTIKNNIDILKIKKGLYGVVNFNNMIPVKISNYKVIDLNCIPENKEELKWIFLLKSQLLWLNKNINSVKLRATKLYNMYKENRLPERIKLRCCNFSLLEEKCLEYNKKIS